MKSKPTPALRKRFSLRKSLPIAVGLCAVGYHTQAEDALMPPPQYSITPPALQQLQTNDLQVFPVADNRGNPLFQWGPVGVRPHVAYRFLSGDGIPSATTNYVYTLIQEISPGLLLSLGDHWALDYTPTWAIYSNNEFNDTLNHYVRLLGGTTYGDWILGLTQTYRLSSSPTVETGAQTEQQTFWTGLTGSYQFNSKMSMDLTLNQNIVSTEKFSSYNEWSTLDWLNYKYWEKISTALGVGLGYVDMNSGSDMLYEQFEGRIGWRATQVISLGVHGGVEFRQFIDGGDLINPIVGGRIEYQPVEVTQLAFNIDRTVSASYFQNQAAETFSLVGSLRQRLLRVLYLDLAGGYHRTQYIGSDAESTGRTDDYFTFNARLSTSFLREHGTAAVFYQFSDNSSTAPGFSFDSNQVGFDVGFRF